jgi:hypothetical protein
LVFAALLAVGYAALVTLGPEPATVTARSLLLNISPSSESGSTTYSRASFRHWIDESGDCRDTRAEVLIAQSQVPVTYTTSGRCSVATGRWYSSYDGATWRSPADVDIDHMVPLKEAWESGARLWPVNRRTRYANDLGFPATLVAVTDNVNQAKSDKDPAGWLPPRTAARCTYAVAWVQVKYRWRLSIDSAERSVLSSILSGSCGSRATAVPARAS